MGIMQPKEDRAVFQPIEERLKQKLINDFGLNGKDIDIISCNDNPPTTLLRSEEAHGHGQRWGSFSDFEYKENEKVVFISVIFENSCRAFTQEEKQKMDTTFEGWPVHFSENNYDKKYSIDGRPKDGRLRYNGPAKPMI